MILKLIKNMRKKDQWLIDDIYFHKPKYRGIGLKRPFWYINFYFAWKRNFSFGTYFGSLIKVGLTVLISVLIVFTVVRAGTITPPSGSPSAKFYTLSEIYNFIINNTTSTEGSHSFTFSDSLLGTNYTLTEIYNALAGLISADKIKSGTTYLNVAGTLVPSGGTATTSNVLSGTTYFGDSQTNWTLATGTMANNGAFSLTASSSNQSVAAGYYSGGTLTGDADLAVGNILNGVNIFGVTGTYSPSGYPGTGWSGTSITQAACDTQNPTWYWFADANGYGDTTDPEDGICVRASTVTSASWNGSEQIAPTPTSTQVATGGSANTIIKAGASWTANAYTDAVAKITPGTASNCWGVVKSNTTDTITVYGSWIATSTYASNCGTPDATSVFSVEDDGFALYDNTWIGDWTCTGSFPSGAPSWGSYPTSAKVGSSVIALAVTDCYDGTRDLLPTEASRAVKTGTATATSTTSITDSSLSLNINAWVGQKVLITGGTGSGGYGRIESNTATVITVDGWTGGNPDVGSTFAIIYLIPHAAYNAATSVDGDVNDQLNGNNGPLTQEVLINWKGTKLPTHKDFIGFCGYKDGGSNYESTTGTYTADKTYGNFGVQVGRTDEFLDLANSLIKEYLSEQSYYYYAGVAGYYACSSFDSDFINGNLRFRAVFRP